MSAKEEATSTTVLTICLHFKCNTAESQTTIWAFETFGDGCLFDCFVPEFSTHAPWSDWSCAALENQRQGGLKRPDPHFPLTGKLLDE